ncbi:MAG: M28 family peptidase [Bacteroidales bacterium]|nr:M28 family peptidase [Bacteroidales bacterium]
MKNGKLLEKQKMLHFASCTLHFAFFLTILIFTSCAASSHYQKRVTDHSRSAITALFMKQHISYLASDSMKGRATPSAELDAAAEYIARQFKSYGLQPLKGSYFQDLSYCYFDLGDNNFLSVVEGLDTKRFKLRDDFVPYDLSGSRPAEGELVFAGYGITAPEYNYDDYKDLDVKGKHVVVLRQEPGQTDSTGKMFGGKNLTYYSGLKEKQKMAQDHGAAGMLVISGPLQYNSVKPDGFSWPKLTKLLPKDALPLDYCERPEEVIPMVQVGEAIIKELFVSTDSLKHIQQRIEKNMQPESFPIPGKILAMNINFISTPIGARNVIGWLEGGDPILNKEAIIIGAHYDHLGIKGVHQQGSDYIYNGADDNASGTTGMLAVASAFGSMAENPKRSVIFIAFAGEELGMLGSASYVRKPLWPLGKTAAMVNLDMIGRNDPDFLKIIGARQNPALRKIVRRQNKNTEFKLDEGKREGMFGGSDHISFFNKGVPVIFFFTGLHDDYHKVTDESDRINTDKAARVARLVFMTAWTAANQDKHYKIVKKGD